ncbi:MAG: isoprenoid biosynthesis glyoxalase ElbB [Planctomycetota bacterium]|nr:isoprenoid biosynthesis glyoxalase ElbB [Planctomycetota bacterium]
MPNTVGVILSGCGYMDGAEIHEAVCTLLALDRAGAKIRCYAPDVSFEVVDHRSGEPTGEKRNALAESARIARGEITDIKKANAEELDAVALPGGFGAAKVLSDFASAGPDCDVDDDVARILQEMHAAKKPILAICIAPAVIARVLGGQNPELTIGNDEGTAGAVEAMGGQHCDCAVNEFVLDKQHRIVTTPAYMIGPSIADVNKGIAKAVEALLDLIP